MAQGQAIVLLNGCLRRLARDVAGNTLAMIAAALFPLLALVGGGVDMGRSYLAQTRLQQACDAGVLAARKRLGSQSVSDGEVPADVATIGNRFFNINFRTGAYGTRDRTFEMSLEPDYAISGAASVNVPTT
ncbi:MAG TPA: Tad domain-containing protein, partial [Novosphingobium sp.]|nr:Tad domain-containing protein [Novosphingobium sp.]